jgi:hypothetical protein
MIVENLLNAKVKRKASLVLWAASLALLAQAPVLASDSSSSASDEEESTISSQSSASMGATEIEDELTDLAGKKIGSRADLGAAIAAHEAQMKLGLERHEELELKVDFLKNFLKGAAFKDAAKVLAKIDEQTDAFKTDTDVKAKEYNDFLVAFRAEVDAAIKAGEAAYNDYKVEVRKSGAQSLKDLEVWFGPLHDDSEKALGEARMDRIKKNARKFKYFDRKQKKEEAALRAQGKIVEGINVMYALAVNNPSSLFRSLKGEIKDVKEDAEFENLSYHEQAEAAINAVETAVDSGFRVKGVTTKMAVLLKALDTIANGTLRGDDVSADIANLQNKIDALSAAVEAEKELRNPTVKVKKSTSSKSKTPSTKTTSTKTTSTKTPSTKTTNNSPVFNPFM